VVPEQDTESGVNAAEAALRASASEEAVAAISDFNNSMNPGDSSSSPKTTCSSTGRSSLSRLYAALKAWLELWDGGGGFSFPQGTR